MTVVQKVIHAFDSTTRDSAGIQANQTAGVLASRHVRTNRINERGFAHVAGVSADQATGVGTTRNRATIDQRRIRNISRVHTKEAACAVRRRVFGFFSGNAACVRQNCKLNFTAVLVKNAGSSTLGGSDVPLIGHNQKSILFSDQQRLIQIGTKNAADAAQAGNSTFIDEFAYKLSIFTILTGNTTDETSAFDIEINVTAVSHIFNGAVIEPGNTAEERRLIVLVGAGNSLNRHFCVCGCNGSVVLSSNAANVAVSADRAFVDEIHTASDHPDILPSDTADICLSVNFRRQCI